MLPPGRRFAWPITYRGSPAFDGAPALHRFTPPLRRRRPAPAHFPPPPGFAAALASAWRFGLGHAGRPLPPSRSPQQASASAGSFRRHYGPGPGAAGHRQHGRAFGPPARNCARDRRGRPTPAPRLPSPGRRHRQQASTHICWPPGTVTGPGTRACANSRHCNIKRVGRIRITGPATLPVAALSLPPIYRQRHSAYTDRRSGQHSGSFRLQAFAICSQSTAGRFR